MNLQTNLSGRLRNTPLPLTSGLLPLFEAVINSIHGIEEAKIGMEEGKIRVDILRKPKDAQLDLDDSKRPGPDALEEIIGFTISDNGIGFTDANMVSFHTLDSEHKSAKGCRGVGRLLWLKAFKHVNVVSIFEGADSTLTKRSFVFDAASGVSKEAVDAVNGTSQRNTSVHLDEFQTRYRDYSRKTLKAIAECLLEHCLWYFIRPGGAPDLVIADSGETVSLQESFEAKMHASALAESVTIKGSAFDLLHVKLRSNSLSAHAIAYCADNRLVFEEKLAGKVPGLHGHLSDDSGEFIYSCYVSSSFLDEHVRPERTGFDLLETMEGLLEKSEITQADIRDAIAARAKEHLAQHLASNIQKSKERIARFVSTRAPRYRPILSRIPEDQLNVDPDISDKDLDLTLHKQLAAIENE